MKPESWEDLRHRVLASIPRNHGKTAEIARIVRELEAQFGERMVIVTHAEHKKLHGQRD